MRKVKYLFIFLIALCFMPNMVNATQNVYFKPYKVGDKITVTLDKDEKVKGSFIVIESSEEKNVTLADDYDFGSATEDYQYVTAIYDGTVGKSVYSSGASTYDNSTARSNLVINTANLGWINYKELRLLTTTDLKKIGGENYVFSEMKTKYPWLVLEKDYWLGDDSYEKSINGVCEIDGTCNPIKIIYATSITDEKQAITVAMSNLELRPVIKIHKGFVENGMICNCTDCEEEKEEKFCPNDAKISIQACIDGGSSEESCIKKLCPGTEKTENPKTGSYVPFVVLGLGMIAMFACISTKNKTYFRKIK